jgi:hypothetical protein
MQIPPVKRPAFFSRVSWCILAAGFLSFPLLAVFDDIGPRLHPEISDGTSIAGAIVLGLGPILFVVAPWFSPRRVIERLALSVATAFGWFVCTGVFLSYYNEWQSHRRHAQEIERAFTEQLLPATAFIKSFALREHRLPTDDELASAGWGRAEIAVHRDPAWLENHGVPGQDFVVETTVPDWNLFYQSWDNRRVEANWE